MAGIVLLRKPWLLLQALDQLTQWSSSSSESSATIFSEGSATVENQNVPWLSMDAVTALVVAGGRLPVGGPRRNCTLKQLGDRRPKGGRFAQIVQVCRLVLCMAHMRQHLPDYYNYYHHHFRWKQKFQYPKQQQDATAPQQDSGSPISCELSDGKHCVWALLDPQAVQDCLKR